MLRNNVIMGSETEFGFVSDNSRYSDFSYLNAFNEYLVKKLVQEYGSFSSKSLSPEAIEEAQKYLNWWQENLSARENENLEKEELNPMIFRRLGASGAFLSNGSRAYIDVHHPEYSTPECTNPFELVTHELAGELIFKELNEKLKQEQGIDFDLMKRNWDYFNSSYGCHENYLLSRDLFNRLISHKYSRERVLLEQFSNQEQLIWISFLVSRVIITGSGRIDASTNYPQCFSISQRAPFISHILSLDTTNRRALINIRDRPYADCDKFGRLHVICADANRCDWALILKYGIAQIILLMLEDGFKVNEILKAVEIQENPIVLLHKICKNWNQKFKLANGQSIDSAGLQKIFFDYANEWYRWRVGAGYKLDWISRVLEMWDCVLTKLKNCELVVLSTKLDWVRKKYLFEEMLGRGFKEIDLQKLDFLYHNIGDDFFSSLKSEGYISRLIADEDIKKAQNSSPQTRATVRKNLLLGMRDKIKLVSWHSFIFVRMRYGFFSKTLGLRLGNPFDFELSEENQEELKRFYR